MIGLLILVALILSACQPIIVEPEPQPSDEEVTAAVETIWDEYAASVVAGDIDRWIAQWTEDGVQMPPNEPFVEGKENIFARVEARMQAGPTDEFIITPLETQNAGDWAYSRGVYTVKFPLGDTGEQGLVDGKFMTILQRQPDGAWKIHRDIYSSNVQPTAMAQPSDEDVTAAVNALWDEYEASQMAGDPDRWIALWTDEGVKMPPDTPAIEGTDQIYARAQRSMADPVDEMVITALETQSFGDMAYSRGVFSVTFTMDETGEQISEDGKFMTILQRQPDGSWKIHRDIHNWNAP
jgi:uncharacterized protein (TIGR02246 family)